MTVYVLLSTDDTGYDTVEGVFSSLEKAKKIGELIKTDDYFVTVEPYEIDRME